MELRSDDSSFSLPLGLGCAGTAGDGRKGDDRKGARGLLWATCYASVVMTKADIALAFALFSLIAVFIMWRQEYKGNLPRQDREPC